MRILGVDPGSKGVAILLDSNLKNNQTKGYRFKFDKQGDLNTNFIAWCRKNMSKDDIIILEKPNVGGASTWGSTSIFRFGNTCGQINMACRLVGCRVILVPPKLWQKKIHEGLPTKLKAKEKTLLAYKRLFPIEAMIYPRAKKYSEDAVDAMMMAVYGMLTYQGQLNNWKFNSVWEAK